MSEIDELFEEGWTIAEHVGMTEVNPKKRYETAKDKEDFVRTLLDYIYWLNQDTEPVEKVVNPKINDAVVDYYRRASDFGE
jgi:hypothetical protein